MHGVFHVVFGYVFHVCDCVIMCYNLRGKTYTWSDVYGKCDCAENYIHGVRYIGKKKWNAKVRNYNLKGSEKEMNMKILTFGEINKRSGWKLAPLR